MFITKFNKKNSNNKYIYFSICILIVIKVFLMVLFFTFIGLVIAYGVYYALVWFYGLDYLADWWDEELNYILKWLPDTMVRFKQQVLHNEDTQAGFPNYYLQFESFSKFFNDVYV